MTKPTTAQWKAELANLKAERPAAAERGTYADHPDQVALFDGPKEPERCTANLFEV